MLENTIPLEEIFELLANYGRPSLNQFSVSATPGHRAAGLWNCEVSISAKSYTALGKPAWYFNEADPERPKGFSHLGKRMIGGGTSPREAAMQCLDRCIELAESPAAPCFDFVSVEECRRREIEREP